MSNPTMLLIEEDLYIDFLKEIPAHVIAGKTDIEIRKSPEWQEYRCTQMHDMDRLQNGIDERVECPTCGATFTYEYHHDGSFELKEVSND